MSDVFSTQTTHADFIPEIWSKELVIARESVLVMANLIWRFDQDIAQYGNVIFIPTVSNLVGGNISVSTGQLDAEAPTETEKTITINQWYGVRMKVLDILLAQSKYDFRRLYTEKMGYVLGQNLEDYLLAFATSAAANVGTYATDLADLNYRRAVQFLDDARVPFMDRHMILKPAQKNAILGIDKFVRYDATGEGRRAFNGQVPGEIYGVTTHVSPEVLISGSNTSNLMFHKEAIGLAIQKNVKMENFARVGWLDDFGGSHLYGASVLRSDHMVELRS